MAAFYILKRQGPELILNDCVMLFPSGHIGISTHTHTHTHTHAHTHTHTHTHTHAHTSVYNITWRAASKSVQGLYTWDEGQSLSSGCRRLETSKCKSSIKSIIIVYLWGRLEPVFTDG